MTGPDSVPAPFPSTWWSVVREAGDATGGDESRREALGRLIERYWKPVYWHLRTSLRLDAANAMDMTQSFFLHVMETNLAGRAAPERGRFRAYLKTSVRNYLLTKGTAERAAKRGGASWKFSLDEVEADAGRVLAQGQGLGPDEIFELEWRATVIRAASDTTRRRLEESGRGKVFEVFRRYDLEGSNRPSHRDLARELDISEFDVGNHLTTARKIFQDCLRQEVRDTVGSQGESGQELNELFG